MVYNSASGRSLEDYDQLFHPALSRPLHFPHNSVLYLWGSVFTVLVHSLCRVSTTWWGPLCALGIPEQAELLKPCISDKR